MTMNEQESFKTLNRFILGFIDEDIKETYPVDFFTALEALDTIKRKFDDMNKRNQRNTRYGTRYNQIKTNRR